MLGTGLAAGAGLGAAGEGAVMVETCAPADGAVLPVADDIALGFAVAGDPAEGEAEVNGKRGAASGIRGLGGPGFCPPASPLLATLAWTAG